MSVDAPSVVSFFIGLAVSLAIIFATFILARWVRTKLVWSQLGQLLSRVGFSGSNGTINDLREGQCYTVREGFVDYHGKDFQVGERLTFQYQEYVEQQGGFYIVKFEERTVHLHEKENAGILQKIWAYLEPI